jgi:hypothetical protein
VNDHELIFREYSNVVSNIHDHVHGAKIRTNISPNFLIHIHIREYEYESNMAENLMFIFANMNIRPSLNRMYVGQHRYERWCTGSSALWVGRSLLAGGRVPRVFSGLVFRRRSAASSSLAHTNAFWEILGRCNPFARPSLTWAFTHFY